MANVCVMSVTFFCNGTTGSAGLLTLNRELISLGKGEELCSLLLKKEEVSDCRVKLDYVEEVTGKAQSFQATFEAAWSPKHEFLTALCRKYPGVSYASASEEEQEDIYEIYNDPEGRWYSQKYSLDVWGNSDIPEVCEYLDSEEKTLECLKENFGHLCDGVDIDDFDEFLDENDLGKIRHWYHMMPSDYHLENLEGEYCNG